MDRGLWHTRGGAEVYWRPGKWTPLGLLSSGCASVHDVLASGGISVSAARESVECTTLSKPSA